MGKTLIYASEDYSTNAIAEADLYYPVSYNNTEIKSMVTAAADGYYVNISGVITANSSLTYVVFDLKHYHRIVISGFSGSTTGGFFSSASPSSSTLVSAITQSSQGQTLSNLSLNVPSNATHFVFNVWKNSDNYSLTKYVE